MFWVTSHTHSVITYFVKIVQNLYLVIPECLITMVAIATMAEEIDLQVCRICTSHIPAK